MPDKVPFYKASKSEKFKIFKMAMLCTMLATVTLILFFLFADEVSIDGYVLISIGLVGFCVGLGWYDHKYSKLRLMGGIVGFSYGLTTALVFLDEDPLIKIPLTLIASLFFAGFGSFLVWIYPEAYSD